VFISNAYADTVGGFDAIMQRPDFLVIGLMVVAMYFVMIRPQMKKQKEAKKFMAEIKKGDKIVTIGGIHGKIAEVNDTTFMIEVEGGVKLKVSKAAISMDNSVGIAETK